MVGAIQALDRRLPGMAKVFSRYDGPLAEEALPALNISPVITPGV